MGGVKFIEEVGKGFVSDSAQLLLGKLTALLKEQIVLTWGFKDDLEDFKDKFNTIQLMVANAVHDEGKIGNPVLEGWLNKVKDLVFLAEDVLDEYSYEMLRRKVTTNRYQHPCQRRSSSYLSQLKIKTKVHLAIFKSWKSNPVVFRIRMANKVKSLKQDLTRICDEGYKYGIKPVQVADAPNYIESEAIRVRREHVDYESIIGRDTVEVKIINSLCHSNNSSQCLSVIGIYGMAGLGKTTLCRAAYESGQVEAMFEYRIWICVSHAFQFDTILNEIAQQIKVPISSSREVMKQEMKSKLEGKKYLLVLDDIWDTFLQVWEPLRSVLIHLKGSNGSTLLVTSRSEIVLKELLTEGMKEPSTQKLAALTEEMSEKLFWQRVGDEGLSDPVKKEVARSLLKKCNGVPLAIRTLGDMLRSKTATEWVKIEKSKIWNENDDVYPSVKLSFMYLSSAAVKRCFAFCGIFEEDEVIEKDKLIQLWMANGLLQSSNDRMEQDGEQFFDELLGNSLFQEPSFRYYPALPRKLISCKMHDVVHKLASDILKHESSSSSFVRTQHYLSQRVNVDDEVSPEQGGNKLRTLVLFGRCERLGRNLRLLDFKCLRALSLVALGLEELPGSIGMLKHLRYLDISSNEKLTSLPDGLTKLHHLQTLRMFYIKPIPRFPREISKLVNLRHLCFKHFETMGIPKGIGMSSCLQKLPPISLDKDWGGSLRELKSLNQLNETIRLESLEGASEEEAREANLGSKESIESLVLKWNPSIREREEDKRVLDALQPHPNVKHLHIESYMAKMLPEWIMMMGSNSNSPSYLTTLTIYKCNCITCLPDVRGLTYLRYLQYSWCNVSRLEQLESIFHLPRLQKLRLGPFSSELDTIFPPLPLPLSLNTHLSTTLRELFLNGTDMDKVKSIPPQIQYFIALEHFRVENFSSVEEIPEWLCNLTSLKRLYLYNMSGLKRLLFVDAIQQLTSLQTLGMEHCPELKKEYGREIGPQWPKIQHIPYVTFS